MTADLATNEVMRVVIDSAEHAVPAAATAEPAIAELHRYGRIAILDAPGPEAAAPAAPAGLTLTDTERLGIEALALRSSAAYVERKANRPYAGRSWGEEDDDGPGPEPLHTPTAPAMLPEDGEAAAAAEPEALATTRGLADRLTGKVAVGLVIVSGPRPHLKFTPEEEAHVVAEVQNGLSWLAAQSPAQDVTFVHDVRPITVDAAEFIGSSKKLEPYEKPWRDAALKKLGVPSGISGARAFSESLRRNLRTDWAYTAFFTKYKLGHFAYASFKRLVMNYQNGGWGPDNIDAVFAHESGHIFLVPDEYGTCNCGGQFGPFKRPNSNCANCAPGGGVACIMRNNRFTMCAETPYHLGYNGLPPPGPGM